MNACETLSTTQGDEEKLLTFERKVLRKIHGPTRNLNEEYERKKNLDLEKIEGITNKILESILTTGVGWPRLVS